MLSAGTTLTIITKSAFNYDAEGNTTQVANDDNSSTQYTYDDADRLSSVIHKNDQGANVSKSTYTYDGFSRLRIITKYIWDTGASAWIQQSQKKFIYDGMEVLQELDGNDNVIATNVWGAQGRLEERIVNDSVNPTNPPEKYYYHYDGSGNVVAVTNYIRQTVASYEYDAYGNLISSSGAYASQNPWRFSTKYYDDGSGLYYYGFRFYSPGLGRWINRDPIQEAGGINVYGFVGNNSINAVDPYGRFVWIVVGGLVGVGWGYLTGGTNGAIASGVGAAITSALLPILIFGPTLAGAIGAAVGGFVAGLLGPFALTTAGAALAGAIGSIAQYIVTMLMSGKGKCINIADLLYSGVMGAIGGAIAGPWNKGAMPTVKLKYNINNPAFSALGNEVREMAGQLKYIIDSAAKNFNRTEIGAGVQGAVFANGPSPFRRSEECG